MGEIYLVTGGAGFIGSHLVDCLLDNGAEKVVVVDNFFLGKMENLADAESHVADHSPGTLVVYREDCRFLTALQSIIERERPSVIFNLATKPLPYSFVDPEGAFMVSVDIVKNLLHLLKSRKYDRLVHFSSSEAYGNAILTPMDEKHPLNPTTPYAAGKAAADLMIKSYVNTFDPQIPCVIVRPFNVIGERQNIGSYAAVVPLTIQRILRKEKPVIEWDGLQTRDFTYVGDVVEAAYALSRCNEALGKVVNIGQGKETTITAIVHKICAIMGYSFFDEKNFEYRPKRVADVRRHYADISLAKKLIGYEPQTSLNHALEFTIDYYKGLRK